MHYLELPAAPSGSAGEEVVLAQEVEPSLIVRLYDLKKQVYA